MAERANEDFPPMPSLPLVELEHTTDGDLDDEASRYTAPTWVRASPQRRPPRAQYPRASATPVADVYADLIAALDIDDAVHRRVHKWALRARERVVEAIRCHLGDVDALVCGSLASGTQTSTKTWDVDLFVRAHIGPRGWDEDPNAALVDVARWIGAAVGAPVTRRRTSIAIESPGGLTVDVHVGWCTLGASGGFVRAQRHDDRVDLVPFDPGLHRDTLAARNQLLGRDSGFVKLLRLIKHVNGRWADAHGRPPLTCFELEVMALTICNEPCDLAEGIPFFFRRAADLAAASFAYPLAPSGALTLSQPDRARRLLTEAAERCEDAMFATDPVSAVAALGEAFSR